MELTTQTREWITRERCPDSEPVAQRAQTGRAGPKAYAHRLDSTAFFRLFLVFCGSDSSRDWAAGEARARSFVVTLSQSLDSAGSGDQRRTRHADSEDTASESSPTQSFHYFSLRIKSTA